MSGNSTPPQPAGKDWHAWHRDYDDPGSHLALRLAVVQARLRDVLDHCPPGPLRVISICAGQGRDLLGVLEGHPRRENVAARLVEIDPRNAAVAREAAAAAALGGIEVVVGDASLTSQYAGMIPADLVLACGLFGNISDDDARRTVGFLARMCKAKGAVLWTRHRRAPDLVPRLCDWFRDEGFQLDFLTPAALHFCVGVHRLSFPAPPLEMDRRMFTFVGRARLLRLRRERSARSRE